MFHFQNISSKSIAVLRLVLVILRVNIAAMQIAGLLSMNSGINLADFNVQLKLLPF